MIQMSQPSGAQSPLYEFPGAAITKYSKPHGLKLQKFILSWFQTPEVWKQGVGRGTFPPKALEEDSSLPIPASGGCQPLSKLTSCIIIAQYHNQEIDIGTIHKPYSDFSSFTSFCFGGYSLNTIKYTHFKQFYPFW